ncbi:MAG: glycosyltransferase [Rhodanobacteraceae bacterium]|nr:MAG: glycosyltransferase [Rhodanobacteraceae bacterium]
MTTALAIFVKTPGHSPVKTRLAASIGAQAAIEFHRLSARAVAEVAQSAGAGLQPCWAIAEKAALDDPLWRGLPRLWQGEGGLGARLHRVYTTLLARHERVLLVGADAPQLTLGLLLRACDVLNRPATPWVIGNARDGGFWLFGGRRPIAHEMWCGVRYSCADTARQLCASLDPPGTIATLPVLADVDRAPDLDTLEDTLAALPSPLPAQRALRHWLATRHEPLGSV